VRVRVVAVLAAVVCYIGLVANRDQTAGLAAGIRLDLTQATAGPWQLVREAVTLVILAMLLQASRGPALPRWAWLLGTLLAFEVLAMLLRAEIPAAAVVTGLRFAYVALIAVAVSRWNDEARTEMLRLLTLMLVPLLVVEAVIAFGQVLHGPTTLGATQLGARPWGTYASSNNLGLFALGVGALLCLTRIKGWHAWLGLVGALCLATGSRTAVLGFCLMLAGLLAARWRRRLAFAPLAGLALYAVYTWASSEQVSGRVISGEARFGTWSAAWGTLDGFEKLLGAGVGAGSNTLVGLVGYGGVSTAAAVSDSAFVAALLSLGLVGVAGYVAVYASLWHLVPFDRRLLLLPMLGLALVTFNAPEVSPFNLLMALAVGCSIRRGPSDDDVPAVSRRRSRTARPAPAGSSPGPGSDG
jgi:hypothetical protein